MLHASALYHSNSDDILTGYYSSRYLVDALGNYGAYWLFAAFGIIGIAVTAKYLPETRNKSQREIQDYFAARR